ncbi:MAG: LysR family transcriptional regulator [Oscillospiraceae bacterium]|nr:LysR family transcriptional regulator [Oscillospiraceae bacterium]
MTTTQLQYFLAAARTLSFTAAAEELYTTQPTLSRQVALLEEELGVRLFRRDNNILNLTDVGRAFYRRAERLYEDYQSMVEEARDLASGVKGKLRIGLLEDQNLDPKLSDAIHALVLKKPNAAVDILRCGYMEMIDHLSQGHYDVCQTTVYPGMPEGEFQIHPLSTTSTYLAVRRDCVQVEEDSIRAEEVAGVLGEMPLVVADRSTYPDFVRGFLPAVTLGNVRTVSAISSISLYVATGLAAACVNGGNILSGQPGVQMIELTGVPPVTQGLIWRRTNANPLRMALLEELGERE